MNIKMQYRSMIHTESCAHHLSGGNLYRRDPRPHREHWKRCYNYALETSRAALLGLADCLNVKWPTSAFRIFCSRRICWLSRQMISSANYYPYSDSNTIRGHSQGSHSHTRPRPRRAVMVPSAKVPTYMRRFNNEAAGERPALLPTPNIPPMCYEVGSWDTQRDVYQEYHSGDSYTMYGSTQSLSPTSNPETWNSSSSHYHTGNPNPNEDSTPVVDQEMIRSLLSLIQKPTIESPQVSSDTSFCTNGEDMSSIIDSIAGFFNPESE
jgi:hypothetical protein